MTFDKQEDEYPLLPLISFRHYSVISGKQAKIFKGSHNLRQLKDFKIRIYFINAVLKNFT